MRHTANETTKQTSIRAHRETRRRLIKPWLDVCAVPITLLHAVDLAEVDIGDDMVACAGHLVQ